MALRNFLTIVITIRLKTMVRQGTVGTEPACADVDDQVKQRLHPSRLRKTYCCGLDEDPVCGAYEPARIDRLRIILKGIGKRFRKRIPELICQAVLDSLTGL